MVEEKTSSVHFLRFELGNDMVEAVKNNSAIALGVEHPAYTHVMDPLPANYRDSLAADLG